MKAIDITHVIAKLNQLTNHSFRLSGNYEQLRINDLPCFEINWINDVEDVLSLLPEQRNSRQICVFDKITPTQGKKLAAAGVNYIDLAGNAQIAASGLYIFISGQRHKAANKKKTFNTAHLQSGKAFQPSGLRVAYMLLTDPAVLHLSFREIARLANVSLGTVSAAMNDLSSQNFFDKETRQVLNRQALVERWVQAYPYLLRNKLAIGRFTSNDAFFYESLKKGSGYQLSGELAAQLKYNYLTAKHVIAYADDSGLRNLMQDGRLRQLKENEQAEMVIDIFQPIWNIDKNTLFAPEVIIYSDLIASNDPRNIEVAERICHEI